MISFTPTEIPDVILCVPDVFRDARGFFQECYHARKYAEGGIREVFVQDNRSQSAHGVLRGLHFQASKPQAKLISCVHGRILDVAVDLRKNALTFGKWVAVELSEENSYQLFIPKGFAHGFCVLSETAEIFYKCTDYYDPADDRGMRWNDPELAIQWPICEPLLSAKDAVQPFFRDVMTTLR